MVKNVTKKIIFCALSIFLTLGSCAYKTGQENTNNGRKTRKESTVKENQTKKRNNENNTTKKSKKKNTEKLDGAEVFKQYSSAVFLIYTANDYQKFQGSGFFIGEDGLAVSNYHVFQGTNVGYEQIKIGENKYNVSEVIAKSKEEDFILFRVNCKNKEYIPIASSKPLVGEKVYAIGSPRGFENTISDGVVSQWRGDNLMQISVPIDHGSSGGALINEYGEVVGITSGTFYEGSQANVNYAWSIDAVKAHINNY